MLSSEECILDSRDDGSQDHHANPVGWNTLESRLAAFAFKLSSNKARDRYSDTSIRDTPEEAKYVLTSLATASGFPGG